MTYRSYDGQCYRTFVEVPAGRRPSDPPAPALTRMLSDLGGPRDRASGKQSPDLLRHPNLELHILIGPPYLVALPTAQSSVLVSMHSCSATASAVSSTRTPWRSYRFRLRLHRTTTADNALAFVDRRVSAASPDGRNTN
jgi:hypothetical protein